MSLLGRSVQLMKQLSKNFQQKLINSHKRIKKRIKQVWKLWKLHVIYMWLQHLVFIHV